MKPRYEEDLWGRIMREHHQGRAAEYAIRRDDGRLEPGHDPHVYFAPPEEFFPWESDLLVAATGTVLDLGAGPGRIALWAQAAGQSVVAVEASPLTAEVAAARGVRDVRRARWEALSSVLRPEERFDTVLLMGHNLGLAGTLAGLERLLRVAAERARPGAALIGSSIEFTRTRDPEHRRYQAARRAAGRYPGEVVIRVEYAGAVGPYFPWLLVESQELGAVAQPLGWEVERIRREDPHYGVVLRRRRSRPGRPSRPPR